MLMPFAWPFLSVYIGFSPPHYEGKNCPRTCVGRKSDKSERKNENEYSLKI